MTSTVAMTSKYPGKCHICGAPVAVGDPIAYTAKAAKGLRTAHALCHTKLAAGGNVTMTRVEPSPAPAPAPAPSAAPEPVAAAAPAAPAPALDTWLDPRRPVDGSLLYGAECFNEFTRFDEFDGPADMAAEVPRESVPACNREQLDDLDKASTGVSLVDWFGFHDIHGAIRAYRSGWPEGAARLEQAMAEMPEVPRPVSRRRRAQWSDAGDELDIQRVYRGQLDTAFRSARRAPRLAPQRVTVVAQQSAVANVRSEQFFWAGAAVVRLTELLTEAGYSVELLFVASSKKCGKHTPWSHSVMTTVKAPHAPLDLSAAAGVLCNAASFRYFCWKHRARHHQPLKNEKGFSTTDLPMALRGRERLLVADAKLVGDAQKAAAWVAGALDALRAHDEPMRDAA
jgi:hypothetical protein